ncbi:MAG: hypothetical protein OXI27_05330 [Thaumarchaeota archaeon]|nr:hypothetical protein [Nitrososphaerota archaeon]
MTSKTTKIITAVAIFSAIMVLPSAALSMSDEPTSPEEEVATIQAHVEELYNATVALADKQKELDELDRSLATPQEIDAIKKRISELQRIVDSKNTVLAEIQEDLYERYTIDPTLNSKLEQAKERAKSLRTGMDIPFVAIGISHSQHALNLRIDVNALTAERDETYYRTLLAKEFGHVPTTISFIEAGAEDSCSSQTANCDPIVGGISMNENGVLACTIGLPATRDGVEGYITAGHCVGNEAGDGDDVYQPSGSGSKIGDTLVRIYDADCDCAFIDHSGSEDTQEKVWYSRNYYVSVTSYVDRVADGTLVMMTGQTSGPKAAIVDDATDTWYYNSIHWDVVSTTTDVTEGGDSGAPWTSLAKSTLYGIHKGSGGGASYFIPWENVSDATDGLDL